MLDEKKMMANYNNTSQFIIEGNSLTRPPCFYMRKRSLLEGQHGDLHKVYIVQNLIDHH